MEKKKKKEKDENIEVSNIFDIFGNIKIFMMNNPGHCTPNCKEDAHCTPGEYCDYPEGGVGNCVSGNAHFIKPYRSLMR